MLQLWLYTNRHDFLHWRARTSAVSWVLTEENDADLGTDDTADITIWTSIEGNAIIIAACIPTLQPLFDLILGRGVFGSTGDHRAGSGYGDRGCSRVKLATIGSKTRGTGRRNRRLGVSDTTLGQDSQESILSSEQQVEDQQRSGIVKTQQLSVAFENVHQNP